MPRRPVRREGAAGREPGRRRRRRRLRKAAGALKERGRAGPAAEERGGERGDPPRAPCVRCWARSGAERRGGRAAAADGGPATPGRRRRKRRSGRKRRGTAGPGRARSGGAAGHGRGGGGGEPGRRRGAESARGQVRLGSAGSGRRRHCCAARPRSEAAVAVAEAAPQQPQRAAAASEEEGSPPGVLVAPALSSSQYFLFGLSCASPQLPPSPHTPTLPHSSVSSVEAALGSGSFPAPGDAPYLPSRVAREPLRDHEEIQHQEGAGRPDRRLVLGLAAAAATAAPGWEPGTRDPGNAPVRALPALQGERSAQPREYWGRFRGQLGHFMGVRGEKNGSNNYISNEGLTPPQANICLVGYFGD